MKGPCKLSACNAQELCTAACPPEQLDLEQQSRALIRIAVSTGLAPQKRACRKEHEVTAQTIAAQTPTALVLTPAVLLSLKLGEDRPLSGLRPGPAATDACAATRYV